MDGFRKWPWREDWVCLVDAPVRPFFLTLRSYPGGFCNGNLNTEDKVVRLRLDSLYDSDGRRLGRVGIMILWLGYFFTLFLPSSLPSTVRLSLAQCTLGRLLVGRALH